MALRPGRTPEPSSCDSDGAAAAISCLTFKNVPTDRFVTTAPSTHLRPPILHDNTVDLGTQLAAQARYQRGLFTGPDSWLHKVVQSTSKIILFQIDTSRENSER